jgi:hypothetical protein
MKKTKSKKMKKTVHAKDLTPKSAVTKDVKGGVVGPCSRRSK